MHPGPTPTGLGLVHVGGGLAVCDPVTLAGFELGMTQPWGHYPTYVIVAEQEAELLLVRLGGSYPVDRYEVFDDRYGGTIPSTPVGMPSRAPLWWTKPGMARRPALDSPTHPGPRPWAWWM